MSASPSPVAPKALWHQQRSALESAVLLVRVYYVCLFFILVQNYPSWAAWSRTKALQLLWPVAWFDWTGAKTGVAIVIFGSLAGALAAAAMPGRRWCRGLAALGVLEFAAFFNSFGVINHGLHVWIWTSAILVLLPGGDLVRQSLSRRQRYLRVFWAAQAACLLFYSLSGAFKVAGAALQMGRGEIGSFAPEALARHIAYRLQEGVPSGGFNFGPFIIDHPYAGWPVFLLSIYLELFSLLVAFRPAVQRIWGVGLILFHLGIYLTMQIMFSWQMLAVGLLLVCSPFAPGRVKLAEVARQLPVIGDLWGWWRALRRRIFASQTAGVFDEDDGAVAV